MFKFEKKRRYAAFRLSLHTRKTAQRFVLRNEKGAVLTLSGRQVGLICDLAAVTAKLLLLRFWAENRAPPMSA